MPREITFQEFVDALSAMAQDAVLASVVSMSKNRDDAMAEARSKGLRIEVAVSVRTLDNRVTLANEKESREISRDKFVMREDDG